MLARPLLRSIRLASPLAVPVPVLGAEFPSVRVAFVDGEGETAPVIDAEAWLDAESFAPFDEAVEGSRSDALVVRGLDVGPIACEVLTRFQRFVGRRNAASFGPAFDAALAARRAMHDGDVSRPSAELDHAFDVWQWLLRLSPGATLAAQLAALFHDVDPKRGGDVAYDVLVSAGIDRVTALRTRTIIMSHGRRGIAPDIDLLDDADALSFFSLDSSRYADDFGSEETRRKVADTLGRLGPSARARLAGVRLRSDVCSHLMAAMVA